VIVGTGVIVLVGIGVDVWICVSEGMEVFVLSIVDCIVGLIEGVEEGTL
jgi:hypothetical protein